MKTLLRAIGEFPRTALERIISFAKCAAIRVRDLERTKPILVYQMGKVGSLSVYSALRDACPDRSVYHVHFLTQDGWNTAVDYYSSQNVPRLPEHMYISRELIRKLSRNSHHWTVVTLVRDPVARDISGYFQHIRHRYRSLDWSTSEAVEMCLNDLRMSFESFDPELDYTSNWLEREPGQAFDFDVYSQPFDHQRGFSIIRRPRADLLILDSSKINQMFEVALKTTLGICLPAGLRSRNVTAESQYGDLYGNVVARFRIPRALCETIYSTRFAKHFFSSETLVAFTNRWAED